MTSVPLIQDLAVVLLAAGIAGALCKKLGLSVIVGFLLAGMLIGPGTPPVSFIEDVERIQTLSDIGLVFLMFGIGLGLSLTKLGRMGLPAVLATALGAFLMLNFTQLLGGALGWTPTQSLFVAAMFMCSSSAVIAKIIDELHLGHERAAQRALGITVLEDIVAVVMLTLLAARIQGDQAASPDMGALFANLGAFVVLLVGAGLVLLPRLFRRLEGRVDPEIQTILIAGLLFLLAMIAHRAGYSLALGAFLLGAIVAELPQRSGVEKAFTGMRDIFSSVFFVAIGMMIELPHLVSVWPSILGLGLFVLVVRPFACGLALVLVGTPPMEARRAGLLLSPLGEFSFIIAQLGVTAAVLPPSYYPLAVGVSLFTVLTAPLINRHSLTLARGIERIEPSWLKRALEAYHGWLEQLQRRPPPPLLWRLVRGRLVQIALELLLVSGLLVFSAPLLSVLIASGAAGPLDLFTLKFTFWIIIGLLVLIPLLAVWRNIAAVALITADGLAGPSRLPARLIATAIKTASAILLSYLLYLLLPVASLPAWGWFSIAAVTTLGVALFSRRLIFWYSVWQSSLHEVLDSTARHIESPSRLTDSLVGDRQLEDWGIHLDETHVPDDAAFAGQTLAELAIPSRFGCSVVGLSRNGYPITVNRPDIRLYPGDHVLLLGREEQLAAARRFLLDDRRSTHAPAPAPTEDAVLETLALTPGPLIGRTLAELNLARVTGVRVVGVQSGEVRIINPDGTRRLTAGDSLLVLGSLKRLAAFRRWLQEPSP